MIKHGVYSYPHCPQYYVDNLPLALVRDPTSLQSNINKGSGMEHTVEKKRGKDSLGDIFDSRKGEVATREEIQARVMVLVEDMRKRDGCTKEDARLLRLAAKTDAAGDYERCALLTRAMDFDDSGFLVVEARKCVDRIIVEEVRKLTLDVYGLPIDYDAYGPSDILPSYPDAMVAMFEEDLHREKIQ